MATTYASQSAAVRARLNHPVIDSDGHTVEFEPVVLDYLKQIGGARIVDRYRAALLDTTAFGGFRWYGLTPQERRERRTVRPARWGLPAKNTRDLATAMLPKLLYERLDEIGMDFTILYPTLGLFPPHLQDEEVRRAACRAFNAYHAEVFREYADRVTPAAVIPMHTPQEAVEELEYAVKTLGLKVVMMPSLVMRPIASVAHRAPAAAADAVWLDTFCLDSEYDYDPVWAKCVECKVAATFHSGGQGWGSRNSISNHMHNHIGAFAAAGDAVCKAVFMGGVTRRFPTLKFAFLEGGVGWACSLYADLIGHWEKRNPVAVQKYNPAHINRTLLLDLFRQYGGVRLQAKVDELEESSVGLIGGARETETPNDWAPCRIDTAEDIRDLFVPNFYFGCEADDPLNASAFNTKMNPFGAKLQAVFSSDIGHWDVPDMRDVVHEAHEGVEKGLLTEADFRDFVFTNPATLWTGMNPDFFKGTVVETQVNRLLAEAAQ
jgi:predicted TIM-barrel fold metal-dependent hydrolase